MTALAADRQPVPMTGHSLRVQAWMDWLHGSRTPDTLAPMVHPEATFWSPVVHRPIRGQLGTVMYLCAAGQVFDEDNFHYLRVFDLGERAVLEFITELNGIQINGVDMIEWDDAGLITEFKVMVRPKKAMETLHAQMKAMLESMAPKT